MTTRDASVYRCQECGFTSPKPGTCPDCRRSGNSWVQLVEERQVSSRASRRSSVASGRPRALKDISMERDDRVRTGIGELDRVLGGGVVRGSLVLIGGDPGVGKSTLLLQVARALAQEITNVARRKIARNSRMSRTIPPRPPDSMLNSKSSSQPCFFS